MDIKAKIFKGKKQEINEIFNRVGRFTKDFSDKNNGISIHEIEVDEDLLLDLIVVVLVYSKIEELKHIVPRTL